MNLLFTTLPNRFLSITGPDAEKFLQGQASCDINTLNEECFSYGTLNTPKGRMYCLFKMIKIENGLLLSMNEQLLDSTLERLSKYAAFFKCELKAQTHYQSFGITCETAADFAAFLQSNRHENNVSHSLSKKENCTLLNISQNKRLAEIWSTASELPSSIQGNAQSISIEEWSALETQCGIPELYKASTEEFILQTLNLQHLGAVSFKKGCYTGQEIIARMKFLGKVKKHTYLLHSKKRIASAPLETIFDENGQKFGTIVRIHHSDNTGTFALGILPIESALSHTQLFLDQNLSSPMSVSEIDYSEFN